MPHLRTGALPHRPLGPAARAPAPCMARTICSQMIDASPKHVHINQILKRSAPEKGAIDHPRAKP
jgi:hypothetical protein